MIYTAADIAAATGAALHQPHSLPLRHLLTDSRRLVHPAATVFFALKSSRRDASQYIGELYHAGVRCFVVNAMPAESFPEACFLVVKDTLEALQKLASVHRSKFSYPVIGITGSNGKTVVKEWLYQLLRDRYSIVRSPRSYNSQTGVPFSVWPMDETHQLAIFEAGISMPGEMEKLEKIIRPQIGVLTNIGSAHDENFSSAEEKTIEKLKLFGGAEILIYNKDITGISEIIREKIQANTKLFSWSQREEATLQIRSCTHEKNGTTITAAYEGKPISIFIPFTDEASVENAISCWCVMLYLGIAADYCTQQFAQLAPVAMRLELKNGINGCSLINDTYNSDFGSLQIALDFLCQQQQHQQRTVILSDILQSGRDEKQLYSEVASLLAQKGIQRIIGIGESISRCQELFQLREKNFFTDTASFLREMPALLFRNETILVKGARSFGFEAIIKHLQQQAHETVLTIRLDALVHNLNYFRSKIDHGTKLMAMVKAFSYGSGTFEIANILQFHRVDYLAVAYADEGLALRRAGIRTPVMVMNPEEQGYETMIAQQLEPEIFSFRVLEKFEAALQRYGEGKPYPVHLKFDTGMKRLGFSEEEIPQLIEYIHAHPLLKIQSVFSHLAASDEEEHDAFTHQQVEQFRRMSDKVMLSVSYPVMRHILNSAGIQRFPEAQFEMVRLGIGLYGIGAGEKEQSQLRAVSSLKTVISQIKKVAAGETVGYSRKGKTATDIVTATVPIGYADGLSRRLSNGKGKMWINGKAAPVIGNVCMDMTMLNITGIDCAEGDEVIIFDEEHSITDFARDMDTIAYEALTMVSGRVKRVYEQE